MIKRSLAVLAIFSVLTVLYFYPVFSEFGSALIGPPEDNTMFLWLQWYGVRAIWDPLLEFFHTRLMYHPEGMGLWYANYFYTGVAMAAVFQPVFGLVASYNLIVLLSFVLAGVWTYKLLSELTGDRTASLYGAFVYAFNPLHFAHSLHHPSVAAIHFIPLFILFLIRAHRGGGWRDRLAAAAALALTAYSEWNYLIYGGFCLALACVWTAWKQKSLLSPRAFWNAAGIGGGAVLMTAPVLVPMIRIGLAGQPVGAELPGHNIFVADLLGFFVPHAYHSLAETDRVRSLNGTMTGPAWESAVYLGWINLTLVALTAVTLIRRAFPYAAAFAFFAVLALGVELHVGGRLTGIPLPYAVLEQLPFLKHARNPSRTMAFGYLFWAILTAFALKTLFRSPAVPGLLRRMGLVLVAGLGFLDLYSLASDVTPVKLPPVYGPILEDPGYARKEFAIMNIPWDKGRYMMEQTIHGLPDLQGYMGRKFSVPLIGKLPFDDPALQKEMLRSHKVKYILVRKQRMSWDASDPEEVRIYEGTTRISRAYARVYEKLYEDDKDAVFRVYRDER